MEALRLASEGRDDQVGNSKREPSAMRGNVSELTQSLSSIVLPSREVLLTLLWTVKVEQRRIQSKQNAVLDPEKSALVDQPTDHVILKVAGIKRAKSQRFGDGSPKRPRLSR